MELTQIGQECLDLTSLLRGLLDREDDEGRRPRLYDAAGPSAATNSPINADSIRAAASLGRGHRFWDRMLGARPTDTPWLPRSRLRGGDHGIRLVV